MALAAAGIGAAAAYLDARYAISRDVGAIVAMKQAERKLAKAVSAKRVSLWYPFEEMANSMPDSELCLWSKERQYTWRETYTAALRYSQYFITNFGAKRGELVALYMQNSPEFVIAMLGAWAAGTANAFVNFNLAGEGLVHCLRTSGSKVIIVDDDSELRKRIEDVRNKIEGELGMTIVILDAKTQAEIAATAPTRPADSVRDAVTPMDPSMLLYTSGTTGLPKACPYVIMRCWQGFGPRIARIGMQPGPGGGRWYICMPLYHGTASASVITSLLSGVPVTIGKKFSVNRFWDEVRESESTGFVYVGETARYLLANPPSPRDRDHKVRMMFGNGLRPDVWDAFKERFGIEIIVEFFNSTEGVFGLANVCRGPYQSKAVGTHGLILRRLLQNVYVPVRVDTETGDILRNPDTGLAYRAPYSEGGEILVAVPSEAAFAGYRKSPEATKKKFARDVFKKGDLWYRSGDALRRDDDGRWYFMDRLGDTFRWKSENVSTAEVAIALGDYPGVAEANVYGVLLPRHDGRAGCAAVHIPADKLATFDFKGLLAHTRRVLPKYAVPVFVRLVPDIAPTMHNNKQNKVPLRAEGVDLEKVKAGSSPNDRLLWNPPGHDTYVEFTKEDWEKLESGKANL